MGFFRWYGGKGTLVARILPHLDGQILHEPFAGAANVFCESHHTSAILNDLDPRIVNVYRVMQDPTKWPQLRQMLVDTPCTADSFVTAANLVTSDPIVAAWAFLTRQGLVWGGSPRKKTAGCFAKGKENAWSSYPKRLDRLVRKLQRATITEMDGVQSILLNDGPMVAHYVDPPYALHTRSPTEAKCYVGQRRGMDDSALHCRLVDACLSAKGTVVVSGYETPFYRSLMDAGWSRVCIGQSAGRQEFIWTNRTLMSFVCFTSVSRVCFT